MAGPMLRAAATDLAVPRWLVEAAIEHIRCRIRSETRPVMLFADWLRLDADADADADAEQQFTEDVVAALSTDALTDQAACDVLRWALCVHLAPIGDQVLRLSAWPAADLAWLPPQFATHSEHDDCAGDLVAVARQPVPGAPEPLEVRIDTALPKADAVGRQPYFPADGDGPAAEGVAHWRVGWRIDGRFASYHHSGEPSLALAKLAAASLVRELLRDPAAIKAPLTGRLLVPRMGNPERWDDLRRVRLADVLDAVASTHTSTYGDAEELWGALPHQDASTLNCVGLLLDHLSLPFPDHDSAANRARPDDPCFLAFFHANAITLSPITLAYLSALIDAAPDPALMADRHTAAWRHLFADPAVTPDDLAGELGILPDAMTAADLGTIAVLARWSRMRHADDRAAGSDRQRGRDAAPQAALRPPGPGVPAPGR